MGVALAGAAVALALTPVAPAGVPVLAACLAALWGLQAMSTVWITIAALAVATVLIKAAGPVAVGRPRALAPGAAGDHPARPHGPGRPRGGGDLRLRASTIW